MYERFYRLRERPFDLTPNPRFLFLSPKHREALATLQYGLSSNKGITLVTGEAGTGKTTLIRAALDSARGREGGVACLDNPTLTRGEFIEFLTYAFGLGRDAATSKTRLLQELRRLATERHQAGATLALIVDEAQAVPDELLEEIRLLSNVETNTAKLLNVVLTGHLDLTARLNQPHFRQLKQRVALRCVLDALDLTQTAAYIAARIWVASGQDQQLFTHEAIEMIHERGRGIPRTISVICDNALIAGFAAGERPVGRDTVKEVCEDLDLPASGPRVEFSRAPVPASWADAHPKAGEPAKQLSATAADVRAERRTDRSVSHSATSQARQPETGGSRPEAFRELFQSFSDRRKLGFLQLFPLF